MPAEKQADRAAESAAAASRAHHATPCGAFRAPLRITEAQTRRGDLASRQEFKYVLHHADVLKLRRLLEGSCRRIAYRREVSTVRSVYFDDPHLSACRANLDGVNHRRKVRLRWYDSPRPETAFVLEVKWRENRVTGKHRVGLRSESPLWRFPYSGIVGGLLDVLPTPYLSNLLVRSEPVLLVQYEREHFTSHDGSVRVTLDYEVVYYDQLGRQFITTEFGHRHEGLVVVEGKLPVGTGRDLRGILYPFRPRPVRCSKYVHGCRLLGHLAHDS
jgi:hypothetical protein